MKLRPLHDYILVRREKAKEMTDGGLFIPGQAQAKSRTGEVLAVGPGGYLSNGERRPIEVNVGQVVSFRSAFGQEVRIDNEDLVLLREGEIDGVIER